MALLIKAGLVSVAAPQPLPSKKPEDPQPPAPLIPRTCFKPTLQRLGRNQARDKNICIYCRTEPAKYYGPVGGYGVGCEKCTDVLAAKRRAGA